ncbi:hypothetical protein G7Y89_g14330 [Cudoniella acicularis]|uniref:Uncharacterized protein n=1 Tax=Cudoniella acicularis TaxID=354080 RepID=A0A8H4R5C4_9HELO|nr:hypothetical protein G7Y89_g14330 [Cudoniella acicularis]
MNSTLLKKLSGAMILAIACMVARGVYRTIKLLQGWEGYLSTTEAYVIALDGSMIIALVALNVCNPGELLQQARKEKEMERPILKKMSSDEGVKSEMSDGSAV